MCFQRCFLPVMLFCLAGSEEMIKKILCMLLAFVMIFSLSGCVCTIDEAVSSAVFLFFCATDSGGYADKDEIISFVCENEEALRSAVEENDFSGFENKGIVEDVSCDSNGVEFSCGGAGMGPETFYTGFFYTQANDMTAVWCAPSSSAYLKESGDGYEWKEQQGDNRYYTQKICENFYYYEAEY